MKTPTLSITMQILTDVPAHDRWLTPSEAEILARMRFPSRRQDWRLGRWTAKQAVARALGLSRDLTRIAVLAAEDGAPEVFVDGERAPLQISISHRIGVATCLVGPRETEIGCDLETVEERSAGFVADYFTDAERACIEAASGRARDLLTALIWSAKESALKALRTGLREDTRAVEVTVAPDVRPAGDPPEWRSFSARHRSSGASFSGWWRANGDLVLTAAACERWDPPLLREEGVGGVQGPIEEGSRDEDRPDNP